jgi:LysM repeat protein
MASRKSHTVVGGDTLWAIARANNTTVEKLIELNPKFKNNPNLIRVGQTVTLPTVKGASAGWATDFFGNASQATKDEWGAAWQAAQEKEEEAAPTPPATTLPTQQEIVQTLEESRETDNTIMPPRMPREYGNQIPIGIDPDTGQRGPSQAGGWPAHWGDPPAAQTKDLRWLPDGTSVSGTLQGWINENLNKDVADGLIGSVDEFWDARGVLGEGPPVSIKEDLDAFAPSETPEVTGGFTPDQLIELGAVEDLLQDSQYRAFMASFGISQQQGEDLLARVGERLSGQATSALGAWSNPNMLEGQASPEDLLKAEYRSGGLYDIQYDKQGKLTTDRHAGRGMGFSGQLTQDLGDIEQERYLAEKEYERNLLDSWKDAEAAKIKAQEDLIKEKLQKEAEAAERISLFAAGA